MPEFEFTELLPLGHDDTPYRLLSTEGVSTFETPAGTFLQVDPEALTLLTEQAMRDIAHLLRPGAPPPAGATSSTTRRPATTTGSSPSTC